MPSRRSSLAAQHANARRHGRDSEADELRRRMAALAVEEAIFAALALRTPPDAEQRARLAGLLVDGGKGGDA